MGQPYTTGPAHLYAAVGAGATPVYLGTARNGPTWQQRHHWENLMNDIGGIRVPTDRQVQGKDILVSADFTRWEEVNLRSLEAIADPGGDGGIFQSGEMGSYALLEGKAYGLWIQYPYGTTKPAMAELPDGYHFLAASLEGMSDYSPGLKPYSVRVVWYVQPVTTILADGTVSSILYDFDLQGLPAPT